jgi:hypothetical protein
VSAEEDDLTLPDAPEVAQRSIEVAERCASRDALVEGFAVTLRAAAASTPEAVAITREILIEPLGTDLPPSRDDGMLFDKGTGRPSLSGRDRSASGETAVGRFPLLA